MTLVELYKQRKHYQEMISKHLAAGNTDWVNRYNYDLVQLNKKIRAKEKMR